MLLGDGRKEVGVSTQLEVLTRAFQERTIDRRKFLGGLIALGVSMPAALAILEACGTSASTSASKATLVVEHSNVNLVQSFDPALTTLEMDQVMVFNVYQSLLRFNGQDLTKPYPSLATSYQVSSDGKTYTFALDKAAVFSDGTPVTADDAVFSINRDVNVHGSGQILPDGTVASAINQNTVAVTFQQADPAIPWYLAHVNSAILNSKVVMQNGGTDAADASTADTAGKWLTLNSAGSGPYVLESNNLPSKFTLKVNAHYWGKKPVYQRVVFNQADTATQIFDVQKGTAQIALSIPGSQAAGLKGLNVFIGKSPNVMYLGFNNNRALSSITVNPHFREAVRYGIDYDGLLKIVAPAVRIGGYIPSDYLGALPLSEAPARDLTRAKTALAASGLTNPTIPLSFPADMAIGGLSQPSIAAKIQADLLEVGINVQLDGSPATVLQSRYHSGLVAFLQEEDGIDFPDPSAVLHYVPGGHDGARLNWKVGQEPAIDALVATAQSAVDPQARATAYQALQRALTATNAYITLCQIPLVAVASTGVQNLKVDSFRYLTLGDLS